jgi:hypothetical protein
LPDDACITRYDIPTDDRIVVTGPPWSRPVLHEIIVNLSNQARQPAEMAAIKSAVAIGESLGVLQSERIGHTSITVTITGAPMTEIDAIREATAERVRLHRERRRRGLRCLTIEIRDREIDALVRQGLLDDEKRDDTTAIRTAFHQYLDHTLGLC